ncbi:MAG TPA: PadR family transcriptional regulator [Polyangiaceae bacterium]|nr:PadR family transcriptional regulator [Polyangiaceae bacterium]
MELSLAKLALLQALTTGPGFGLELIDRVRDRTDGTIKLHQGSVYPALRSLERDGFVTSYTGETNDARGGRPRIYYRITAEGARAAKAVGGLFATPTVLA